MQRQGSLPPRTSFLLVLPKQCNLTAKASQLPCLFMKVVPQHRHNYLENLVSNLAFQIGSMLPGYEELGRGLSQSDREKYFE